MSVDAVIHEVKVKMDKSLAVFKDDLGTVRTGVASTALVDHIMVDCYGAAMPLSQVATVITPEPRMITIQPWDAGLMGEIEKAILKSDLGLMPNNDGKIIRIGVPPLSEDRRQELIKIVRKMAEDVKIAVRSIRRDANDKFKKMLKDKLITEDDQHRHEGKIQKMTDTCIEQIDAVLSHKESELLKV